MRPDDHDPDCSGCPACSPQMAAIMDHPFDPSFHDSMRRAAVAAGTIRRRAMQRSAAARDQSRDWRDEYGRAIQGYGSLQPDLPADPYAEAARSAPRQPCPFDDSDYDPHGAAPDGYAVALEQRKEEDQ